MLRGFILAPYAKGSELEPSPLFELMKEQLISAYSAARPVLQESPYMRQNNSPPPSQHRQRHTGNMQCGAYQAGQEQ